MPKSKSKSRNYKQRRSRSWSPSAKRRGPRRIVVPKTYAPSYGRRLVWEGVYDKTQGGLTFKDLDINARNKIVSKRQQKNGMKLQEKFNWRDQPAFMMNIIGGTRSSRRKSRRRSQSITPTVRINPSRTAKKSIKYGK